MQNGLPNGPPLWLFYNKHLLLKMVTVVVDDENADSDSDLYYRFDNEYMFVWSIANIHSHFVDVSVEAISRNWPDLIDKLPGCKSQNVCIVTDVLRI